MAQPKSSMVKFIARLLQTLVFCLMSLGLAITYASADVNTNVLRLPSGVVLTWEPEREIGRYADGSFWIQGPIRLVGKEPRGTDDWSGYDKKGGKITGRTVHGMMLNPGNASYAYKDSDGGQGVQGFDSYDIAKDVAPYDPALNIDPTLPGAEQRIIQEGTIVIAQSDITQPSEISRDVVDQYNLVTVVQEPPTAGSLRPPQSSTSKASRWQATDIDIRRLPAWTFRRPGNPPTYNQALAAAGRIQYLHTTNNLNGRNVYTGYGRDIAKSLEPAFLYLALNQPIEQKKQIAYRLVTLGLDIHARIREGGTFEGLGGGQAWMDAPLMLAAVLLDDEEIRETVKQQRTGLARQTFRVSRGDIGRAVYTADGKERESFEMHMLGMAEWGEQHSNDPKRDDSRWGASYRFVAASAVPSLFVVRATEGAAILFEDTALSEYMDRHWMNERWEKPGSTNGYTEAGHALMQAHWRPEPPAGGVEISAMSAPVGGKSVYVWFNDYVYERGMKRVEPEDFMVQVNGISARVIETYQKGLGLKLLLEQDFETGDQVHVDFAPKSNVIAFRSGNEASKFSASVIAAPLE